MTACLLRADDGRTLTCDLSTDQIEALIHCTTGNCSDVTAVLQAATADATLDPETCYVIPVKELPA